MVSRYNLKSYLTNASRIFQIEAMEALLWLIKRVYFFDLPSIKRHGTKIVVVSFLHVV